jgi:hypothetical protein
MRKLGSGCVFWLVALAVVASVVFLPVFGVVEDSVAARRAREEAGREQARAEREREERGRIQEEAQADMLRMYTEAGVNALVTDTRYAHPLEIIFDLVRSLALPAAFALIVGGVLLYRDRGAVALWLARPPATGEYKGVQDE